LALTRGAQLWLLGVVLRGLFSRGRHLLKRVTLSRVVVPAYMCGTLLAVLAIVGQHLLEDYWARHDRLMEAAPDAPAMSRYEYEVAQALRGEILDILDSGR
jgi:hypothetical protein